MRWIAVFLMVLAAGCGGGGGSAAGTDGESCADVADATITIVNEIIEATGDQSIDEVTTSAMESGGSEDPLGIPPELTEQMEQLQQRAEAAGCTDEEMAELLRERADQVDGDGFLAETFRAALEEGVSPAEVST